MQVGKFYIGLKIFCNMAVGFCKIKECRGQLDVYNLDGFVGLDDSFFVLFLDRLKFCV